MRVFLLLGLCVCLLVRADGHVGNADAVYTNTVQIIDPIYFSKGSASLPSNARPSLDDLFVRMVNDPKLRVLICANVGSGIDTGVVSRRLRRVRRYLLETTVDAVRRRSPGLSFVAVVDHIAKDRIILRTYEGECYQCRGNTVDCVRLHIMLADGHSVTFQNNCGGESDVTFAPPNKRLNRSARTGG